MAAAYDTYDYPIFWAGRDYEHESEMVAIKSFLQKIPKIKTILEIGAGFGRLAPSYIYRGEKVILTDPSAKLLKIARKNIKNKKVKFIQTSVENITKKVRPKSIDLVLLVRVIHHINDLDQTLQNINKLLSKKGYFIFEFANKKHLKATLRAFLKGNFTFPIDIFPLDKRSKKSLKKKTLPFVNYHPDIMLEKLSTNGFKIIAVKSVSNIRSPFLKKNLPLYLLIAIEKILQTIFTPISAGPSIFILAQKRQ